MSLTTLTALKVHLGISGTTEDTLLTQIIRGVSSAVRAYCPGIEFGGVITSNSLANPTVITAPGHGLSTGDTITIAGSNCTPTIDGQQTVTRVDDDTFTVAVNVTVAGTAGYWYRRFVDYLSGDGTQLLKSKRRPIRSVVSIYEDSAAYWGQASSPFPATTLLTEGTDYALVRDDNPQAEKSRSGHIYRIGAVWPRPTAYNPGRLVPEPGLGIGNIKLTVDAGYVPIKPHHALAVHQYCAIVRRTRTTGAEMDSEDYDYYSYTLAKAADQENALGGVRQLLSDLKTWVW